MKNQLKTLLAAGLLAFLTMLFVSCEGPVQEKLEEALGNNQEFTITYESEYGDLSAAGLNEPQKKKANSKFGSLDLPALEKDGYNFLGWYLKGTSTKVNINDSITKDMTLVARWQKIKSGPGENSGSGSGTGSASSEIIEDTTTEVTAEGIKLTIKVPAHTDELSIRRIEAGNEYDGWVWDDKYEVYRLYNNTSSSVQKEITDIYGIEKGKTYKYALRLNWDSVTELSDTQTATADGKDMPVVSNKPTASFDGLKVKYGTKPTVNFGNGPVKEFALESSYIKILPYWLVDGKEEDGDNWDWDFGFFPQYDTREKNEDYQIYDSVRGYELTLVDYTFKVFLDKDFDYISHYAPDTFDFPQKIYSQNLVEDTTDGINIFVRIPAGNRVVRLFKYNKTAEKFEEYITKEYERPLEKPTDFIFKDCYDNKAGEEINYYVEFDYWKRFDGWYTRGEGDKDERGITFTSAYNGKARPGYTLPKVNFNGLSFEYLKKSVIDFKNNEDWNYWLFETKYQLKDKPENESKRYSQIYDYKLEVGKLQDITQDNKNLDVGDVLVLESVRFTYGVRKENYEYHWFIPLESLKEDNFPKEITISSKDAVPAKAEDVISMEISFPAKLAAINILRREVNNVGKPVNEYEQVGGQWPKANDSDNFDKAQTKTFIDRYTVQKDHYYEYKAEFYDENWNYKGQQKLGIHLAGKDGYPKPTLSKNNYPDISVEETDKGILLKLNNEDPLNSMDYSTGGTPIWISFNLQYSNGITDFNPWLGSYGTENRTYLIPTNEWLDAGTGCYFLNGFCVNNQFEGDYFDRQFWYDHKTLDSEKIVDALYQAPVEMENGGFEFDIRLPFYYLYQERVIQDVYIQCREKPTTDPYNWPPVVAEPAVRKGCLGLDSKVFDNRVKNGKVHFKDYYGFEKGKTYQYRALVRIDENWDVIEFPLCEVVPTKDSLPTPTFKNDVKPEFSWDAKTQTLSATNRPVLDISNELLAEWGCGNNYEWAVSAGYANEKKDAGFWPWFLLKSGDTWNELHTTFSVDDWNSLGNSYTMTACEYYLEIYIPGEGIGQCIPLSPDDLGTAKTLSK